MPTEAEEAVRDLCRTRADLVSDRTRARHRLSKFLLRHGRIWRDGQAWTLAHQRWLLGQRFDEPALAATYRHYRAGLTARDAELAAVEADLARWLDHGPFTDAVARLSAYRGVAQLGALTLASEVGDWRRFPAAPVFMGFTGLVPSEYSSGQSVHRGRITKAGNAHLRTQLIESAWAYQHGPNLGSVLRRRQQRAGPATAARSWAARSWAARSWAARSWAAQQRLCARFRRLSARKTSRNVVTVARRQGTRRVPLGRDDHRLTTVTAVPTHEHARGPSGRSAGRARPDHDASGHAVAGPIPVRSMAGRHRGDRRI
jgi:transposase